MLNTKLEEFIQKTCVSDLIDWINENPNLIYHNMDALLLRMKSLVKKTDDSMTINSISTYDCVQLIHALYTNRGTVTECEFMLLEAVATSLMKKDHDACSFTREEIITYPILSLLMVLLDAYDIENGDINEPFYEMSQYFYQTILDIYIPCDNPKAVVKEMIDGVCCINHVLANAYNTAWLTTQYNALENRSARLKDIMLVFQYISDIYSNRDMKFDYFIKLHELVTKDYMINEKLAKIVDRYGKYFKENTVYIITEILDVVNTKNPIAHIENFMSEWCQYHKRINAKAMVCLINEVEKYAKEIGCYTTVDIMNDNVFDIFRNKILSAWDTDDYIVDDVVSQEMLLPDDTPLYYLDSLALEAVHKDSPVMDAASKKIYKAYRTYKDAESKVDSQLTKACSGIKKCLVGDVRTEIIEGKKYTPIGLLKRVLGTVGLFSVAPVKAIIAVVVGHALKKKTTVSERRKIIMELETEIEMITEKINDARGDDNREAKYAMMRTKKELENALKRIQYGIEADDKSTSHANKVLNDARSM